MSQINKKYAQNHLFDPKTTRETLRVYRTLSQVNFIIESCTINLTWEFPKRFPKNPIKEQYSKISPLYSHYANRYNLFEKFDDGIQLDDESLYSITPKCISEHIALHCQNMQTVADFCSGVGGNSIRVN